MEYFDIVTEDGRPTGETVSREDAHRDGIPHRTAHVWIVREKEGRTEILLQKRSEDKDSFPGLYDTSSAGHIPAGDEPLDSAIRELREELGVTASPEELSYAGNFHIRYDKVFHDQPFRDNEVVSVYVLTRPVDSFTLQESEVSEVRWFDLEEVWNEIVSGDRHRYCVPTAGLSTLKAWIRNNKRSKVPQNARA